MLGVLRGRGRFVLGALMLLAVIAVFTGTAPTPDNYAASDAQAQPIRDSADFIDDIKEERRALELQVLNEEV
jgi:hypothetical protein